ncbi:MAG: hypothetical protein IPN06_08665 [Burkholderiales bacterium]|nr:hypothetical protein [Burkholderiales bacterium]
MLQTPPDPTALAGLLVQVNALAADVRVLTLAANSQVAHLRTPGSNCGPERKSWRSRWGKWFVLLWRRWRFQAPHAPGARQRARANIQRFAFRPRFEISLELRLTGSVGPCGNTRHPEHRHCQRRTEYPLGNSLMMAGNLVEQGGEFQKSWTPMTSNAPISPLCAQCARPLT